MDIFDIPPHPAADVFPLLPDDELEELAADIRANGLLMPLLVGRVDGQTVLVDGRNRREACRRAGIIPNYTLLLDGEDLPARIVSENVYRRHLTKGQQAMVVAKVTRNLSARQVAEEANQNRERIRQARFVLCYGPELAESVINGSISLDNAYEEARIRKGRSETHESRFNALKAAAPDLADLVVEDKLTLEEAQVAYDERVSEERPTTWGSHALPVSLFSGITCVDTAIFDEWGNQTRIHTPHPDRGV
jgi:hypothetical protein